MQPVVLAQREPLRHRLHALAIARTDQPRDVERAHAAAFRVPQTVQERRQPSLECHRLVLTRRHHGRLPEIDLP